MIKMKKILMSFIAAGVLAFAGVVQAEELQAPDDYILHAGDTVSIGVVNKMQAGNHTADVNGRFTMDMIGDVCVTNKTVAMLRQELAQRLSRYIKEPEVVVNIAGYGSVRVKVLGKVRNPGNVELTKHYTVLDAISKAGGFTYRAAKRKVVLIHAGETEPFAVVNVQDILQGKKGAVNPVLREDDLVYVDSNGKM